MTFVILIYKPHKILCNFDEWKEKLNTLITILCCVYINFLWYVVFNRKSENVIKYKPKPQLIGLLKMLFNAVKTKLKKLSKAFQKKNFIKV